MFWRKRQQTEIEFHSSVGETEFIPQPASKFIPEWYKSTPRYAENPVGDLKMMGSEKNGVNMLRTIKKCMPFLDTLTAGYIIPHYSDTFLYRKLNPSTGKSELIVNTKLDQSNVTIDDGHQMYHSISSHPLWQVPHLPAKRKQVHEHGVLKFFNPWIIRTPPGYSCLFVPPLNHNQMNSSWEIIPGIVDTDAYDNMVLFPFLIDVKLGQEVFIKAGEPLVHVIPFKREDWTHKIFTEGEIQKSYKKNKSVIIGKFYDIYKNYWWKKKKFQ